MNSAFADAARGSALLAIVLVLGACRTPAAPDPQDPLDVVAPSPVTVPADDPAAASRLRGRSVAERTAPGAATAVRAVEPDDALGARLSRLFDEARALVEADSDTDLSGIRLQLADDATLLDEVAGETRRLVHGRLGRGPLAERLLGALVGGRSGTYAALYAARHRTVMVSREVLADYLASLPGGRARHDTALLVLMLHELVHAADDLRHGIHANRTLDFRASFAQSAAFEGHAQWRTREICRRHGCLDGLDSLDAFMFGDADAPERSGTRRAADEAAPAAGTDAAGAAPRALPADRNLLEYSYVEGERFVTALAARPDGERLIERLLAAPPHDPLQILDPASFPNEARETRNRDLLSASRSVAHPWLERLDPRARVLVETSPLKGVNLRRDPARRDAAIDGFTRLVTAMVAVQFHDPSARTLAPIEVTLMQTDAVATARLFAGTLHAHALVPGARASALGGEGSARGLSRTATALADGGTWRTAIATDGVFVVQASGRDATPALMDDYVLGALDALLRLVATGGGGGGGGGGGAAREAAGEAAGEEGAGAAAGSSA